jgi:methylmalonyl-CoA/ethylmalonyl-CoA epimerase
MDVRWVRFGGTSLEFIAPRSPDSRVAELLAQGAGGVHHVALAVEDVDAALVMVRARGVTVIDASPRSGAGGTRIAFLDPRDTAGALVELVEIPRASDAAEVNVASEPAAT